MEQLHKLDYYSRLSETVFLRPPFPISKSTLWDAVRTGRFLKPIKLNTQMAVWRVVDIKVFIEKGGKFNSY